MYKESFIVINAADIHATPLRLSAAERKGNYRGTSLIRNRPPP